MFGIGVTEIIIIAIVFGILFFGSKKMVEFSRSLGRLSGEFKKGKSDIEKELKDSEAQAMSASDTKATTPVSAARSVAPHHTPENKQS